MKRIFIYILLISLISVNAFAQGYKEDVNGDNTIDISDVNSVINVITGKYSPNIYSNTNADSWYVNMENPVAMDYMNTVDYYNYYDDYSVSFIKNYRAKQTNYRKDQGQGVFINWDNASVNQKIILSLSYDFSKDNDTIYVDDNLSSYTIYNLIPQQTYYYRVLVDEVIVKENHFYTLGQVRMMHLNSLRNTRDLGGWKTIDGGKIRYGIIYRGAEINTSLRYLNVESHEISKEDSIYMHDKMNIRLDMDLRDNSDLCIYDSIPGNEANFTPLGSDVEYYNESINYSPDYFQKFTYYRAGKFARTLRKILNTIKAGNSVYFHCVYGADRTGMISMLIEGLCGVSESDINKDFELTSFYLSKDRTSSYWESNMSFIKKYEGDNFQEKVKKYCLNAGLTQTEINDYIDIMVEH